MRKARVEVLETCTKRDEKTGRDVPGEPKRLGAFDVSGFSLDDLRSKAASGAKRLVGSRTPSINFRDAQGTRILVCVPAIRR